MTSIIEQAQKHSEINKWAWVVKEGKEIYFTDSDEITQKDGIEIVAEFLYGKQTA